MPDLGTTATALPAVDAEETESHIKSVGRSDGGLYTYKRLLLNTNPSHVPRVTTALHAPPHFAILPSARNLCASQVAWMSLLALREKAFAMAASLKEKLAPLEGPLAKLQEKLYDVYETVLPYGVTAFYYSFIPIVVLIGYRNAKTLEPKLRFWDLLSPM